MNWVSWILVITGALVLLLFLVLHIKRDTKRTQMILNGKINPSKAEMYDLCEFILLMVGSGLYAWFLSALPTGG